MANNNLEKLNQLTIEEEKMDKDDDSIDISKENYLSNKSLREALKMMQLSNIFAKMAL